MFNFFKFKKTKQQPTALSLPEPKEEKKLRIAYTVYPDERLEYNEFWKRIYEETKKI